MVRVKIGTDIREYPQGTTWAQVAEEYQSGFEHDILLFIWALQYMPGMSAYLAS